MNQINTNDILTKPEMIVPLLSEEDITAILVDAIIAYLQERFDIDKFIKLCRNIEAYKKISFTTNMKNTIEKVISGDFTNEFLKDWLNELTEKLCQLTQL